MKSQTKVTLKTGILTGLLLALASPMSALAGSLKAATGVTADASLTTEARTEQLEEGIPTALEVREKAQVAIKANLDEAQQLELEDPKTGKTRVLKYKRPEEKVLRVDGDFATAILGDAGFGLLAKGKIMTFAPFANNLYVGRSHFRDVKSGAEVEVDTWMDYGDGELEEVVQVISSVDGEARVSYSSHASTDLSALD